jgi:hypothetical protein
MKLRAHLQTVCGVFSAFSSTTRQQRHRRDLRCSHETGTLVHSV